VYLNFLPANIILKENARKGKTRIAIIYTDLNYRDNKTTGANSRTRGARHTLTTFFEQAPIKLIAKKD